eukprot:scaffold4459_cov64-Cyclotella_meneghiniana.AAC.4
MSSESCAACGKADGSLKSCKACKLVKYCNVDCQVAHRSMHKKACQKKARELFEQKLFAKPPAREDCPICMQMLPLEDRDSTYQTCCGKIICNGCMDCLIRRRCPFCNTRDSHSREENHERLLERIEKYNDAGAMTYLAGSYYHGVDGYQVDRSKAYELYQRAGELGSANAHCSLGNLYRSGEGMKRDMKKAVNHLQIAAIMGNVGARYGLGRFEVENCNLHRAMKHFVIAAKCGCDYSLDIVKQGFKDGYVTKEDFEKTLRDYQASCDETKSEQRDRAAANYTAR